MCVGIFRRDLAVLVLFGRKVIASEMTHSRYVRQCERERCISFYTIIVMIWNLIRPITPSMTREPSALHLHAVPLVSACSGIPKTSSKNCQIRRAKGVILLHNCYMSRKSWKPCTYIKPSLNEQFPQMHLAILDYLYHPQIAMRLPYVPNPPQTYSKEEAEILARVQARRAPGPLQSIDLTLLHAPYIAAGWASFLGAVRNQSSLPADLRELAILRVAALCGSKYEMNEHSPYAARAGVSEEGIKAALEGRSQNLSEKQWAVVQYAESMTKDVKVPRNVFDAVKSILDNRQVVELTATVAALNCAARFLVALDVGEFEGE